MTAPAVALLGGFAVYQALPQGQDPVVSNVAAYHLHTLPFGNVVADGSGTAMATQPPSSGTSGDTASTARPRQSVKAEKAQRSSSTGKAAAPTATPAKSKPSPGGGTADLKSAVQKDIADGNYVLAVGQYLVENGYSRAAAAGVASCVDGESGGNPESVGSGGGGLIGWTPISSASPNSNVITGNAAQDMMTQLADVLYYNSTEIGQSLVAQLDSISDPVAAADYYSQNFEKPAVTDSDVVPSVAEQVFSEMGGLCR